MSKIFNDIKLGLDEELESHLEWLSPNYGSYDLLKKSIDARRGHPLQWVYSVRVYEKGETPESLHFELQNKKDRYKNPPVLIIGAGPAGLFAALRLLEQGIPCCLFEQGSTSEKRLVAINRFWRYGELNEKNNVGFGEGGAGLYSDGKLITRIKSPHISYVMDRLIGFGAPEEIRYLSNPHVGSDKIRRLIPVLRKRLLELGGELHFDTTVDSLILEKNEVRGLVTTDGRRFESPHVILACGHSADELFRTLHSQGVFMEGKSFAIGLRIEHPQKLINEIQYREHHTHPTLGAASYRLAHHDSKEDVGVYSFCMCPGGYVLSSGTKPGQIVSNGMSNYRRNSAFANSALVVSVDYKKSFGSELFAGLEFRNRFEAHGFELVKKSGGSHQLPAQSLTDFLERRVKNKDLSTSSPSGVIAAPLHDVFSQDLNEHFVRGIEDFQRKMRGFINKEAVLHGVESRTSCPLRITRHKETLESVSHRGLYPAGEGAGYAGGITSAACDGINIADRIVDLY